MTRNYPPDEKCIVCHETPAVGRLVVEVSVVHSQWADRIQVTPTAGFVCLSHLREIR